MTDSAGFVDHKEPLYQERQNLKEWHCSCYRLQNIELYIVFRCDMPEGAFAIYSFHGHSLLLYWPGVSSECNNLRERACCLGKHETTWRIMAGNFFSVASNLQKSLQNGRNSTFPVHLLEPPMRIELMTFALRERRSTD